MNTVNGTHRSTLTRRTFLAGVSALSAGSLLSVPRIAAAEPPPRLGRSGSFMRQPSACRRNTWPKSLRLEGFTEIEYVQLPMNRALGPVESGQADMTMGAAP